MSEPPRMLRTPADPPPPLDRASHLPAVQNFQRELAAQRQLRGSRRLGSIRATARAWAGRISGRADRRLLIAIAGAADALVTHCDVLTARLNSQEALTADVAAAYGEDLTRLRAETSQLHRLIRALEEDRSGST